MPRRSGRRVDFPLGDVNGLAAEQMTSERRMNDTNKGEDSDTMPHVQDTSMFACVSKHIDPKD